MSKPFSTLALQRLQAQLSVMLAEVDGDGDHLLGVFLSQAQDRLSKRLAEAEDAEVT